MGLVKPDPSRFNIVSEFSIPKDAGFHYAHLVIHNGVLLPEVQQCPDGFIKTK